MEFSTDLPEAFELKKTVTERSSRNKNDVVEVNIAPTQVTLLMFCFVIMDY